jgi:tetratricopeptide (TPR) repeat protein
MKNMLDKQDKYGNVTFGEATKLLINTIGQNAILDIAVKKIPKSQKEKQKKLRDSLKKTQERIYSGEAVYDAQSETDDVYHNLVSSETEEARGYYAQLFKDAEQKYGFSAFAKQTFAGFTGSFFYALANTVAFEKLKKDIALFLLKKQTFHYIYDSLTKGIPLLPQRKDTFKPTKEGVLTFLTDSYKKIFDDIFKRFESKEAFYKSIKGLKSLAEDYKENITNWCRNKNDPKSVYNPNWQTLVPVLDFLHSQSMNAFAHRLINLYLRKNAQKALADVLHISEDEQEKIIIDIVTMLMENRCPEEFYEDIYANDLQFAEQISLISMYLSYQNYTESFDPIISNNIMSYIEDKCPRSSEKFFSPWLKARAKVFERHSTLKDDKNAQKEILANFKKAFENGIAYAGWLLPQFLLEGIVINDYFNPRREKDANDFFGYGYVLEIFGDNKQKLLDWLNRDVKCSDIRGDFIGIYHRVNSAISYALINEYDLEKTLSGTQEDERSDLEKVNTLIQTLTLHSFQLNLLIPQPDLNTLFNKAIIWNNKGLEYKKAGLFLEAGLCFNQAIAMKPHYVNAYTNRGDTFAEYHEKYNRTVQYWQSITFSDYNIALLLVPTNEIALFNRALLFKSTKQYKNAIADLSRLVEINQNDFEVYAMLGACYLCMNDITKAEEYCIKAITINPDSANGHWNLGNVYKILGDSKKAMFHCKTAIKINPDLRINLV